MGLEFDDFQARYRTSKLLQAKYNPVYRRLSNTCNPNYITRGDAFFPVILPVADD